MNKNKLKIQFFGYEIDYHLQFKQVLESISTSLKRIFMISDPAQQINALDAIYKQLEQEKQFLKQNIYQTKTQSDLVYNQAKLQERTLYQSHEDKIQQLNQILFQAENAVQRAEAQKKQMDQMKAGYQMNNRKAFKYKIQTETINKYLKAQHRVIKQFIRSIDLMFRVSQRESHNHQLIKLYKMKGSRMTFNQMRRLENFSILRRAHSHEKNYQIYAESQNIQKVFDFHLRKKNQPLLALLTQSEHVKYKKQRQRAIQQLVHRTREKNRKQALLNKLLAAGIELQKRDNVLKYLGSKSQLNQQESIAKIQLMSSKLNQFIDQRFLSLKGRKVSKQFNEGERIRNKKQQHKHRKFKSQQKLVRKQNIQQITKKRSATMISPLINQKHCSSNPKTNDSLTPQRFISL